MEHILSGIDTLERTPCLPKGMRLGLITCPSGVTRDLRSTVDVLHRMGSLTALFAPEHGLRGNIGAGDPVAEYRDARTGLPVYSIYGGDHRPSKAMLDSIDMLLIDVQDVGSRYYTFISTVMHCMEACAESSKAFGILDRINPIGGTLIEGNLLDMRFQSFVGIASFPIRHGMTMGELARYLNDAYHIGVELTVIPMTGWRRDTLHCDTDLQWINPSPNLPNFAATMLYNGTCLFEGTNMSEGRGTTRPFELIGAPWLDADRFADALNERKLPGVHFRPSYFTPTFSKHAGTLCAGVQAHVLDVRAVRPVALGLHMLEVAKALGGSDFQYTPPTNERSHPHLDLLAGTDALREPSFTAESQIAAWQKDASDFAALRKPYLLYT